MIAQLAWRGFVYQIETVVYYHHSNQSWIKKQNITSSIKLNNISKNKLHEVILNTKQSYIYKISQTQTFKEEIFWFKVLYEVRKNKFILYVLTVTKNEEINI